ncbi:MAG: hypothetical protein AUK03_00010 [Anaerolineae bacterium CG2_30_64_16]|nr:MAG: hypothetical protein AUK03_00010 [Anaerolineae bacterium CG2_30_64_16]
MEKKSITAHEPRAALLSAKDVDADVVSLSEALIEEQARSIARNVLLRSDVRRTLQTLVDSGVCQSQEEAIARGIRTLAVAVSPVWEAAAA